MSRTLTHPVFLICAALAVANQLLEKWIGVHLPLIHAYLDDLLCFPIVLTLGLAMYRCFRPGYRLVHWHVWPTVLIYSVYFEWYLPERSAFYTADVLDVVMYVMGALLFLRYINRSGPDLSFAGLQNG